MKLVLVNSPALIVPWSALHTMIKLTTSLSENVPTAGVITPTVDSTMSVDNYPVCTSVKIAVTYTSSSGTTGLQDSITINGTSIYSTINNKHIVLKGDKGTGPTSGIQAEVISCGQTSTSVD